MSSKPIQFFAHEASSEDLTPVEGHLIPSRIANALKMRLFVTDRTFDRFLHHELRVVSEEYWTPLAAAVRAAEWLDEVHVQSVVDIGSGAGKFCVIAALAGHAHFTGMEQRTRLVAAARDLAHVFEVHDRVTFVHGKCGETPVPEADAYYLYNPFGENLFEPEDQLDRDVELGSGRYLRDVGTVEQLLRDARVGTYLLTYNGFGGRVPTTYRELRVDRQLPNVLRLWRKQWPTTPDG